MAQITIRFAIPEWTGERAPAHPETFRVHWVHWAHGYYGPDMAPDYYWTSSTRQNEIQVFEHAQTPEVLEALRTILSDANRRGTRCTVGAETGAALWALLPSLVFPPGQTFIPSIATNYSGQHYTLREKHLNPVAAWESARKMVGELAAAGVMTPSRYSGDGFYAGLRTCPARVDEDFDPFPAPILTKNEMGAEVGPLNVHKTMKLTDDGMEALFPPPPSIGPTGFVSAIMAATGRLCGNCRQRGHNRRTCTAPPAIPRGYLKMGVEIEGWWNNNARASETAERLGMGESGDGSIRNHLGLSPDSTPNEFQTVPGDLETAAEQLHELYPDETNPSCGMHVHLSFSPTDTMFFMRKDFFRYFRRRWAAWGLAQGLSPDSEFFVRLRGDNTYCLVNENEPTQTGSSSECRIYMDRYRQLNFSAWNEHRTVEQRMLPMFQSEKLAMLALKETVSIFEDYLASMADIGVTHELEFPDPVTETEVEMEEVTAIMGEIEQELELVEPEPLAPGHVRLPGRRAAERYLQAALAA